MTGSSAVNSKLTLTGPALAPWRPLRTRVKRLKGGAWVMAMTGAFESSTYTLPLEQVEVLPATSVAVAVKAVRLLSLTVFAMPTES